MAEQLYIRVTLKKSGIGYNRRVRQTLVGLGLKKMKKTVSLKDTPAIRGMISKVQHLVSIEE